jgi:xanthine dehydrogenase YagR molybdenum-binding subunit
MDAHPHALLPTTNRPRNKGSSINDDASRQDAPAKVSGQAKYARDMYLQNSLFAAFVRCPWGAGELTDFDKTGAMSVPGVVEVAVEGKEGKFNGGTVGYVVADSPLALRRGLHALKCQWTRKPAKASLEDAIESWPEPGDKVADVLKNAEHVLQAEYSTAVHTHACLETHGCVVDHKGDSAIVYSSTQGTYAARDDLEQKLGLAASKFEVVCEHVGGGFGSKLNGAGKEGGLAASLAKKHTRPVYVFLARDEDQLDSGNRPSSRVRVKIGFKKDGTIVGGHIASLGGTGVGKGGGFTAVPSGRYNLGEIVDRRASHKDVSFNAGPPRPARAPAAPQGAFVEELMLDEIALACAMDPLELRKKLDTSDDRREMLDQGAAIINWNSRTPTDQQKGAIRRGLGVASGSWHGGKSNAECEIVVHKDGSVEVRSGAQDIGTGTRTMVGVAAADALGIPLTHIDAQVGRSRYPIGPNSGGSITAHSVVPAVQDAGLNAKKKVLEALAPGLGAPPAELDIVSGRIVRAGQPVMTWTEACAKLPTDTLSARGDTKNEGKNEGHSHGAQFCEVQLDTETGVIRATRVVAIQACGRVVCRKTAENQIIGGVIQGLSVALFENRLLDRNTGAMVNPNLEMYKILGPNDCPLIEPIFYTKNQTGVRSVGEPGIVPTAGALACAVFNALGVPLRHLPLTPDKVLAALEGGPR